jgi:uncharacterized protein (DUF488 family)
MATIFTAGHGALAQDELVSLLRRSHIRRLIDVRAFPASRRHPHFSREPLAGALERDGIAYEWQGKALGGFRKESVCSPHHALRNPMFRGYAEHMQSPAFIQAARSIIVRASAERVCVMCAESDPAHCHRSLIADWLVAHGHRVVHLLKDGGRREHALNPLAAVEGEALVYRGAQEKLL